MTFDGVLTQVQELLQREQWVSYCGFVSAGRCNSRKLAAGSG
jgi:hypothetical protein